jgi:hypothetical protein
MNRSRTVVRIFPTGDLQWVELAAGNSAVFGS